MGLCVVLDMDKTTDTRVSILLGVCGAQHGQTTQTGVRILLGAYGARHGQTSQTGVSILLGGVWCSTWTNYPDWGEYTYWGVCGAQHGQTT